jgi:hypothetical protein
MWWTKRSSPVTAIACNGNLVIDFKTDDDFFTMIIPDAHSTILPITEWTTIAVIRKLPSLYFFLAVDGIDISRQITAYVVWNLNGTREILLANDLIVVYLSSLI